MWTGLLRCLFVTLLVAVGVCLALPAAQNRPQSRVKRSSFLDIQCHGAFNKSIYAKLNTICDDCYELYKEPELHGLCREDCFSSRYFHGCVQTLRLESQSKMFSAWIQTLHGNQFQR